ncbi:glycoside hydrolase [Phialemonium atrogriseum]|uniref:Glycoside hydrolase n=1 Tax=Phialemonium atrogriseum TaxID=1093897 RepID=A0AAJ0BWQ0_9PEZI|nr:glycoside hydrolase [Phialemonium atrogriseum]KAK1765347.1 glycoside hydrolase [Phialemonium atrogriseum]
MVHNACALVLLGLLLLAAPQPTKAYTIKSPRADAAAATDRERTSLNAGWQFSRFTSNPDSLSYNTLNGAKHQSPSGTPPGSSVQYVQPSFDDGNWETGTFNAPGITGGMGRLPLNGVGWYRRNVSMAPDDEGKSIFLDIDGAMSYAGVWLNGNLVGGWPYGYASFRLDVTAHMRPGDDNLLAIRLDNALDSSRFYAGAGIYRNVWLVKVNPTHVGQYGTHITTPDVSAKSATLNLVVEVENMGNDSQQVDVVTEVHVLDPATGQAGPDVVATFEQTTATVAAGGKQSVNGSVTVTNPLLWGPPPAQKPNLYVAVTTLSIDKTAIDTYETRFGIRSVTYDGDKGVLINGQAVRVQGTNNHADHGSLGTAFHTWPMADRLGFMVLDEIFDVWNTGKNTNDFHLIFADWHEPDLRSFIRRDRNHLSVIAWSFGNEVSEQSSAAGGSTAQQLRDIVRAEDATRPTTVAMDSAGAGSALAGVLDIESLNYQGEGRGTTTQGSFSSFHQAFPRKIVWSSESSSALGTRGTYVFPVTSAKSADVGDGSGGNSTALQWGSSPDKVFEAHDRNPYVAGEFVWSGFDYLGEPTPYDSARSSYFGIVDLAGFKKDRFYLYQSRWRSDLPMAHILPHWTWPERVGQVTPVHVYSSGDEAELFVNGKSAGRLKRQQYAYRFRWDDVVYQPGNVSVVVYKNGARWAEDTQKTVGNAAKLNVTADRTTIDGDGYDLSYITVAVVDSNGDVVPRANNAITFSVSGPGQIVSTDNGDPADMTAFPSLTRKAYSGLALAIVRANAGASGKITVSAAATGLAGAEVTLQAS